MTTPAPIIVPRPKVILDRYPDGTRRWLVVMPEGYQILSFFQAGRTTRVPFGQIAYGFGRDQSGTMDTARRNLALIRKTH